MSAHLSIHTGPAADLRADWLAVFQTADGPADAALDARLGGAVSALRERGDFTAKPGEVVPLWHVTGVGARRVMLCGLGPAAKLDRAAFHAAASAAGRVASAKPVESAGLLLPSSPDAVLGAVPGFLAGCEGPGLRKAERARHSPARLAVIGGDADGLRRAGAEARAVSLARELVNMPPADLGPDEFARRAVALATDGVSAEVFDEHRLASERMGALLGVGRGSARPPRLLVLRYAGAGGPPLALVGKGVTFDSGGLSLKTSEQMVDMKCDMAGAAAVLAATLAAAELRLPVNLLAVMPLAENMPGGRALKLGDVLTARNGTTIEVLNTDAEGRLILADALSYAVDQGAARVLDLATLTGACMVALGADTAGLMGNDDGWRDRVAAAARRAGERAWPLPADAHYDEMLKSNVADIKNTAGGRYGGAIAGAKFLERFVGGRPWAHLDIAGPAWAERESPARDAGGTGYGVRTLVELMHAYAG